MVQVDFRVLGIQLLGMLHIVSINRKCLGKLLDVSLDPQESETQQIFNWLIAPKINTLVWNISLFTLCRSMFKY